MIPQTINVLEDGYKEQPSYTHRMNLNKNTISGRCDSLEAMRQAVYKVINTERYQYSIYSWNYGIELQDLIGLEVNYCMCEIERRIKEALKQDDRVKDAYDFEFETPKKGVIFVTFKASTTEGVVLAGRMVNI